MQYLHPLFTFLSEHPLAAMLVALMFVIPVFFPRYIIRHKIVLIFCAVVWLIYGYWEVFLAQWKPELTDMAARADIVFIGPLLIVSFFIGLMTIIRGLMRKVKPTDSCSA